MGEAAAFHLSCSKASTDSKMYEFDRDFDRAFPIELLAVQAFVGVTATLNSQAATVDWWAVVGA